MSIPLRCLVFLFCVSGQQASAQSRHNPDAHTHGVAQMTVLYESGKLLLELETPAANMLGFEHKPQDAEQWQQLSKLDKALSDPQNIIRLQEDCKVQNIGVELPFDEADDTKSASSKPVTEKHGHDHGEVNKSHHDDHKNHDDHKDHDSHSHDDSRKDEVSQESHQDIHLNYEWQCSGKALPVVQFHIFKRYPNFENIHVQWIADGKQGAATLDKKNTILKMKQ